ncbi:MAG: alpha/beta fold hydrolase [Bacteroidota bacterium]
MLLTEGDMLFLKHKGASMPVLVRGNFDSDVIILFLHGGAGGTAASHIEDFKEMVEPEYIVAYWDQRHAGSSQGNFDKDDWTIDLMAEDMQMVINMLKRKYGDDKKVFAMGHSWGVILGTYYLLDQENQLQGAIFSNGSHSSEHEYSARLDYVHDFAQEMIDNGIALTEEIKVEGETFTSLEQVVIWTESNDPIDSWTKLKILNGLVNAVFDYVQETYVQPNSDVTSGVSSSELRFQSPYNPLIYRINLLRTGQLINNFNNETSIQEFYDFTTQMGDINIPISLIWGKYDHIVGLEVAEDYYQVIGTPEENKELTILENSGHSGMYRENIKFSQTLIDFVEKHR